MNKLSICVTSYNRPNELQRCLASIDYSGDLEVIISDDASPRKNEISNVVCDFRSNFPGNVIYNDMSVNVGYDLNLRELVSCSSSEYIIFITDDDEFFPGGLEKLVLFLRANPDTYLILGPYNDETGRTRRRLIDRPSGIQIPLTGVDMYHPILVSGLVFRKSAIPCLSDSYSELNSCIYSQVFMALCVMQNYGYTGFSDILIINSGGGDNGFGTNSASDNNNLLADRMHFLSNIEFNKGLIVAVLAAQKFCRVDNFHSEFSREFWTRSIGRYVYAVKFGRSAIFKTYSALKSLNLNPSYLSFVYAFLVFILGERVSSIFYKFSKLFRKS